MTALLADRLELIATGCIVVLVALSTLWLVTWLIGLYFTRNGKRNGDAAAKTDAPAKPEPDVSSADGDVPEHHRVAIAATVASILDGAPHRIVRITAPAHRSPGWRGPRLP